MTGGEILIESLKAQGIGCIVGMPGNQNIDIYDALLRSGGIEHYLIRNEQTATLIANGYARASGEAGVALTVPGPGATNASTGIVDACTDCVPVLLVTGGTEVVHNGRDRSKCFHGLDQAAFFAPIARAFARPERIEDIPDAVVGVFKALRAPRPGPAVIELPTDIAAAEGEVDIPSRVAGDRPAPDPEAVRRASEILSSMARPVILAGGNTIAAEATAELRTLAEALNAPVVLTRLGKGAFPDGHPLCASHCRAKLARRVLEHADGLLAVGCRFTQIDTSGWTISLPQRRVQLDPDPAEIGREVPVDAGVVGDLKQALPMLLEVQKELGIPETAWNSRLDRMRREVAADRPPLPIMSAMREVLEEDAVVSVDVTSIAYRAFDEFEITHPRAFLYPCHSVTLGFAVPAAIGAKLACPHRQVAAFCGDGGFQMTAYELATAAEHGIEVVFVVINDGSLSAIRGAQTVAFEGRVIDTDMQTPHIADMARALGARGIRVEDPDRFPAIFADVMGLEGPTVIEVMMQDRRDDIIRQVPWLYPD
jgi:acetolactate synthase-1/2/3 large subunit